MIAYLAGTLVAIRALAFWYAGDAASLMANEPEALVRVARGVDHWSAREIVPADFATGDARYNGEWAFATRMMSIMGYAQLELAGASDPDGEKLDLLLDDLLSPAMRVFDGEAWSSDALEDVRSHRISKPHAGYLGYLALAMTLTRAVNPESRHVDTQEAIVRFLRDASVAERGALLQTYPGEIYPPDNSFVVGALSLHARLFEPNVRSAADQALRSFQTQGIDPATGLLVQTVGLDGSRGEPRGSGTAIATYAISFADFELSRRLDDALVAQLYHEALGFGAVDEFPGRIDSLGDVDSGPVILGLGVSASGFALAGAKLHDDPERFAALSALAGMVGGRKRFGDTQQFALGGPLGDALLFAVTTASREASTYSGERR